MKRRASKHLNIDMLKVRIFEVSIGSDGRAWPLGVMHDASAA
jgi:hypothetical protein